MPYAYNGNKLIPEGIMSEIKSRGEKPVPGVEYSELSIPDEKKLGTGTFRTVLEPRALSKINPIISSILNEPIFKLMVNINLATESVTILLGKADKSPPLSREIYKLPKVFKTSDVLTFDVIFKNWKIQEVKMGGNSLEPAA
jgi:hypothetical protein